jgi:hypothetical protein
MIMNETKKLHLAIGDLADVESQDANGDTTGNFGDNDPSRALGVATWNVQHEVWNQAVVTFEQDGTVYEVYVTPIFNEDINGLKRCFEVKLEYAIPSTDVPHHLTTHTETVSYDTMMKTSLTSRLFG